MQITLIVVLIYIIVITGIVWKIDGQKSGLLILAIFLFFILIPFFINITEDTNKYDKARQIMDEEISYLESKLDSEEVYNDKYQLETFKLEDGSLLIKLFNERDEYVDASCFTKFYDNGKEVDVPNFSHISDIAPHSYGYGIVHDYYPSNDTYKKYQSDEVKVYIEPYLSSYYVHCENDIEYTYNQEEGIIYGLNKYDGEISSVEFGIIYYDENGKIIDYRERNAYNISPNNEFNIKNYHNSGNFEVLLNSAVCKK